MTIPAGLDVAALLQDLRAWACRGHLAHYVSKLVDTLDPSRFYAPYEGDEIHNSPFDLLKVVTVLHLTGLGHYEHCLFMDPLAAMIFRNDFSTVLGEERAPFRYGPDSDLPSLRRHSSA